MKYLSPFLALVVIALVALMVYERRRASQEIGDLREELGSQVATLKAEQGRRTSQIVRPMLARVEERARPVEEQDTPPQEDEPQPAPSAAPAEPSTPEERAAKQDLVFQAERVDHAWAREASHQLRDGIESILPAGALRSVECRNTLCKAELVCADRDEVATFFEQGFRRQDRFWQGAATVLKTGETPDGKWTMAAFFARDGSMIPSD